MLYCQTSAEMIVKTKDASCSLLCNNYLFTRTLIFLNVERIHNEVIDYMVLVVGSISERSRGKAKVVLLPRGITSSTIVSKFTLIAAHVLARATISSNLPIRIEVA